MLVLTVVVGANVLTPLNFITDVDIWYLACILFEILVIISAFSIKSGASLSIMVISSILIWCHLVAWKFTGHLPNSVYRTVEPILEYLNILSLSVFATPTLNYLKERTKQWLH